MRVVGREKLEELQRAHADTRRPLAAWLLEVEEAQWDGPQDVKEQFPSASFLPDNVVIFNLKGPKYRIQVQIAYGAGIVAIQRTGTHAEYNRW